MPWEGPKPDQPNPRGRGGQTPPDLEALLRQFIKKLSGKSAGRGGASVGGGRSLGLLLVGAVLLLWFLSGIYIVAPAERAVVLRFGKYLETVNPGPHWVARFIDSVQVVNVQRISNFSYQSEMLTRDENIVFVALSVQFRVNDAQAFLFNVKSPLVSIQQATASALRQVVGNNTLDEVLTTGRGRIRDEVTQQLDLILAQYNTGLLVADVNLQPAKPPEEVTAAFDDAIKAREDEQRYINQAEAYAKKVIPIAQGNAARALKAAEAYQEQVILRAKGDVAGFLALLPEYKKAPKVTKERLYLQGMESVFDRTRKILVDANGANNMMYLPLDKLFKSSDLSRVKVGNFSASPDEAGVPIDAQGHTISFRTPTRQGYTYSSGTDQIERGER